MTYSLDEQKRYPDDVARVKNTIYSLGDEKQVNLIRKLDGYFSYVIDFVGKDMAKLPSDQPIKPIINFNGNGELVNSRLIYNLVYKGWRVILNFTVKKFR